MPRKISNPPIVYTGGDQPPSNVSYKRVPGQQSSIRDVSGQILRLQTQQVGGLFPAAGLIGVLAPAAIGQSNNVQVDCNNATSILIAGHWASTPTFNSDYATCTVQFFLQGGRKVSDELPLGHRAQFSQYQPAGANSDQGITGFAPASNCLYILDADYLIFTNYNPLSQMNITGLYTTGNAKLRPISVNPAF